jgi:hypothetical protein
LYFIFALYLQRLRLCDGWAFEFRQSVAEVDFFTKIDFMQQSSINNVQPEQELNNEQMPIDTTSSPTNAKPIVGCSASSPKVTNYKNGYSEEYYIDPNSMSKEKYDWLMSTRNNYNKIVDVLSIGTTEQEFLNITDELYPNNKQFSY